MTWSPSPSQAGQLVLRMVCIDTTISGLAVLDFGPFALELVLAHELDPGRVHVFRRARGRCSSRRRRRTRSGAGRRLGAHARRVGVETVVVEDHVRPLGGVDRDHLVLGAGEERLHHGRAAGGQGVAGDQVALLDQRRVLGGDPFAGQGLEALEGRGSGGAGLGPGLDAGGSGQQGGQGRPTRESHVCLLGLFRDALSARPSVSRTGGVPIDRRPHISPVDEPAAPGA